MAAIHSAVVSLTMIALSVTVHESPFGDTADPWFVATSVQIFALLAVSFALTVSIAVHESRRLYAEVREHHEITRRHGLTPIGWLDSMGLLNERAIIGHGIFLDDHPSTRWHTDTDWGGGGWGGLTAEIKTFAPWEFAIEGAYGEVDMGEIKHYTQFGDKKGRTFDLHRHGRLGVAQTFGSLGKALQLGCADQGGQLTDLHKERPNIHEGHG